MYFFAKNESSEQENKCFFPVLKTLSARMVFKDENHLKKAVGKTRQKSNDTMLEAMECVRTDRSEMPARDRKRIL